MTNTFVKTATLLAIVSVALAVETKTWVTGSLQEFDKGELKGVALSNRGRITLAPAQTKVIDADTAQFWAMAADAKGTVYAGGADGKIYTTVAGGQSKLLATLDGGAVFALALDSKGALVAAVSPSGKIYKVAADGKASELADTKAKYVWALAFDAKGVLYAATGEPGQILAIEADGKTRVVLDAGESHVRAMAIDGKGNLVAGTEPGGAVVRVSPPGEAFLLLQTSKREVTAVAAGAGGVVYVAATGNRGPAMPAPQPVAMPKPVTQPAGAQAAQQQPGQEQQPQQQAPQPQRAVVPVVMPGAFGVGAGGSEIYRIEADGEPALLWSSAREIVYALAVGPKETLYAATGNDGRVYRIDSRDEYTRLADLEAPQATALAVLPSGAVVVATANPAQAFQLGPELAAEGVVESEVFDGSAFTYWGRLKWEGEANGGSIAVETRSGNSERAQKFWSPWKALEAGRVASPASRYMAWRATLKRAQGAASPVLSRVDVAYQQKNTAPQVGPVEVTPPNYKFSGAAAGLTSSTTLNLPPIGQERRDSPTQANNAPAGTATMSYDKGWQGARWRASDANGDSLQYKVEIRAEKEQTWKKVQEEWKENRISFQTTPWADGRYLLRITATDKEDNYPGDGLEASAESEAFAVDNTPPSIEGLTAKVEGGKLKVSFTAADAMSALQSAEMSVNGANWVPVKPTTRITDSQRHEYAAEASKPETGEISVTVKVLDERDNVAVRTVVIKP